ncbi:MAG: polyribonucleotide nucleotidyltransferase [Rhodopirellula sp.]|nr:polyribonucleotide nucleotidyltransferase [Rhodopirellula sp.]
MTKIRVEKQIGDSVLSFETGELGKQASATVIVQYGDTVVLNAVTTGSPRPGTDFFPLTCDYRERYSAAGKFPGGFLKREGRPGTNETLTARLTDRPIRPLFPKGFFDEVQCQSLVLSSDEQNDGDVLAMNGAAVGCHISSLPFDGPVASVRVARIDGEFKPFPTVDQLGESDLDMIVSGNLDVVLMIEGFAREIPEDDMVDAILYAHGVIKEICELQNELYEKCDVQKTEWVVPEDDGLFGRLLETYGDDFKTAKQTEGKLARNEAVSDLKEKVKGEIIPDPEAEDAIEGSAFNAAWYKLESACTRQIILAGSRQDGRGKDEVRDISCTVDVLPRTHGSAVFQRGETQALVSITLGTSRDEQRVDGLTHNYSKKFMLDYNFPAFSVGECRPNRGPGRREIGHGMLAERSIRPIMPDPEDFPYTVRVISDILESNGSSSMASVCGATLGLMAAGVKIKAPVAGISVGLVQESEDDYILLTDIVGDEDHFGDMDFKIAGTQRGITGIQLDLKIKGVSEKIIRESMEQSKKARFDILKTMLSTIQRPRAGVAEHAPRLERTKIDPEKIGMLIGPGGKNIRQIQEDTGTVVEVDDEGVVTVAATSGEWATKALEMIEACTATVQVGKIYDGTVSSIKDFGVFVEILPGRDGLCHISELSTGFISNINSVVSEGDEMKVKCIGVDDHSRIKLSRKAALEEMGVDDEWDTGEEPESRGNDGDDDGGSRDGGDRRRSRGGDRRRGGGGGGGGGRRRRRE